MKQIFLNLIKWDMVVKKNVQANKGVDITCRLCSVEKIIYTGISRKCIAEYSKKAN